eukprot:m.41378 g.41378  ORF g.41378 m.41378 type:complete len:808 (-) comp6041_c0_seq3:93-2516(-)
MAGRALIAAAEAGNESALIELLETRAASAAATDEDGATALHYAAANGHDKAVSVLLKHAANPEAVNRYGWTPLMQAALYGHASTARLLLQQHVAVDKLNELHASATLCAARAGNAEVISLLLAAGASPNGGGANIHPLMVAAQLGHEAVIRILLEGGADVNAQSPGTRWTALMYAALNGHVAVAELLLQHNADCNKTNLLDMTALDVAMSRKQTAMEALLETHTSRRRRNTSSATIRHLDVFEATKRGELDLVQQYLKVDHVDPNKRDADGATCLMFAAMRGHAEIAQLLVDSGADIDAQDSISGWTALMQATYYGHKAIARLLLDAGASLAVQAKNGCSAFDIASIIGDTEVIRLLAAVSMRGSAPRPRLRSFDSSTLYEQSASATKQTGPFANMEDSVGGADIGMRPRSQSQRNITDDFAFPTLDRSQDSTSGRNNSWWSKVALRFHRLKRTPFTLISSLAPSNINPVFPSDDEIRSTPVTRMHGLRPSGSPQLPKVKSPSHAPPRAGSSTVEYPKTRPLGRSMSMSMIVPSSKLPANVLAPIKPPFMAPPAFDLPITRPQMPKSASARLTESAGANLFKTNSRSQVFMRPSRSPVASPDKPQARSPSQASFLRPRRTSQPRTLFGPSDSGDQNGATSGEASSGAEDGSEDLSALLRHNNLGAFAETFTEQEIDYDAFLTLSDSDLEELGIESSEARQRILSLISDLNLRGKGGLDKAVHKFRKKQEELSWSGELRQQQSEALAAARAISPDPPIRALPPPNAEPLRGVLSKRSSSKSSGKRRDLSHAVRRTSVSFGGLPGESST